MWRSRTATREGWAGFCWERRALLASWLSMLYLNQPHKCGWGKDKEPLLNREPESGLVAHHIIIPVTLQGGPEGPILQMKELRLREARQFVQNITQLGSGRGRI